MDNLFSSWNDIKKIKNDFINDTIVLNDEDKNKLYNFLNPVFQNKHYYLNLLYRRGNDMIYKTFHDKCDNVNQKMKNLEDILILIANPLRVNKFIKKGLSFFQLIKIKNLIIVIILIIQYIYIKIMALIFTGIWLLILKNK